MTDLEWRGQVNTKLDMIVKAVEGNGKKGLRERVEILERWRSGIVAVIMFVAFVAGLWMNANRNQAKANEPVPSPSAAVQPAR
jgi:hypothetical protein